VSSLHSTGSARSDLEERGDLAVDEVEVSGIEPALLAQLPVRLASVPTLSRIVIQMHYLQELSQQEIAEALEIPLGTVKSRIAYGLSALRRAWLP
jgi:RNA polymerase sigma factor (sigma-70 family)